MVFNTTHGYWEGTFDALALGTYHLGIEGLKIPLFGESVDDATVTIGVVKYMEILSGYLPNSLTRWNSAPSVATGTISRDPCALDVHAFCVNNTEYLLITENGFRNTTVIDLKMALADLHNDVANVKCMGVALGIDAMVIVTNLGAHVFPAISTPSSERGLDQWAKIKHRASIPFEAALGGAGITSFNAIQGQDACVEAGLMVA